MCELFKITSFHPVHSWAAAFLFVLHQSCSGRDHTWFKKDHFSSINSNQLTAKHVASRDAVLKPQNLFISLDWSHILSQQNRCWFDVSGSFKRISDVCQYFQLHQAAIWRDDKWSQQRSTKNCSSSNVHLRLAPKASHGRAPRPLLLILIIFSINCDNWETSVKVTD